MVSVLKWKLKFFLFNKKKKTLCYICDVIWENLSVVAKCKIDFMVSFKSLSELFPQLFELCLYDIHIQSYD